MGQIVVNIPTLLGILGVAVSIFSGIYLALKHRSEDKQDRKDQELNKILKQHEQEINRIKQNMLTKADVSEEIRLRMEPIVLQLNHNTQVTEEIKVDIKELKKHLGSIAVSLAAQEGMLSAKNDK